MLRPTGVSESTFQNLLADAGVFIEGLEYQSIDTIDALETAVLAAMDTDACLGMTTGGGTFTVTPESRAIEGDGIYTDMIGLTVFDKITATLATTIKEITPENLRRILATTIIDKGANTTTITQALKIDPDKNYIKSLCWVGGFLDGSFNVIDLKNALNLDGMTMTFADKGEASIPVTFKGHNESLADLTAPYVIKQYHKATTP